mgnify:CR=1 FL=1
MFTDTAYLKYICILRKKQKPGTLLSHSGPEKVPGYMHDFFMELFCSSPSLPLAVLIKFQVRSTRFLPRYAALTCSLVSNSAPVPERVRVPVSST